ncbi:Cache 3/Cache 2 fusion domain-containing protein [Burkholderiaceae bacterium UC74_6]
MASTSTSIARRVSLFGAAGIATVLIAMSLTISLMLSKAGDERTRTWIGDKTASLVDALDAMDGAARQMVERNYGYFRGEFKGEFALDSGGTELSNGGVKLNGNFDHVDRFTAVTGGVATVFAAKGDDFQRVSTSLKNPAGERVMGTMLGKASPAYASVSSGQAYTGRATLFGKNYMTRYDPVKDSSGKIVGILFIGFDLDAFDGAVERMVANAKFFEHGGTYIVNPTKDPAKAVLVAHPTAKGKLLAEMEPGFVKTLFELKDRQAFLDDAPNILSSPEKDNFAVLQKSEKTGFWVVAQVSRGEAQATTRKLMWLLWGLIGVVVIGLGLGLAWMMNKWVAEPLGSLTEALGAITSGDLTHAVRSRRNDEIGQLIQQTETMREKLAQAIGTVRHSVDSISTASSEIATGNQDLSQRTEQTASNLQAAAGSLTQLTGTVRQTADSALTANQLVSSAAEAAAKGGEVVGQVVSTMEEINASSRRINDIIGTIDGIAFQTNILALNAAVEAARAGEQGRGFAVVAGEVRSLAQRSAEAAKEIKSLIQASVERVEVGSQLVQQAGVSMSDIVSGVQRVQDIIGEISSASAEQSDGIVNVNQSVAQLDQMTQQNAALVEQSAAAAESLREQAHKLVAAVQVFRVDANAGEHSALGVPASKPAPVNTAAKAASRLAAVAAPKPASRAAPRPAAKPASPAPKAKAKGNGPLIEKAMQAPSAAAPVARPAPAPAADGDWETF